MGEPHAARTWRRSATSGGAIASHSTGTPQSLSRPRRRVDLVLRQPAGGRLAGRLGFVGVGIRSDEIAEQGAEDWSRTRVAALSERAVELDRVVELAIDVAGDVGDQRGRRLLARE